MADLPRMTATGRTYLARFAAETVHVWLGSAKPGNGVSAPALERLLHDGLVVVGDPEPGKGRPITLTDLGRAVLANTDAAQSRTGLDDAADCECLVSCAEDPRTACSLSGTRHVHSRHQGVWGPCSVHPDAPGDH